MCTFFRGDFAAARSTAKAAMGADVEADCRAGINEHAVDFAGRPGKAQSSRASLYIPGVTFQVGRNLAGEAWLTSKSCFPSDFSGKCNPA